MTAELKNIAINQIHAKSNYRKIFKDSTLAELATSIKENGVIEPIIVRPNKKGFEIIAGERRFRASQLAGLVTIPAVVRETSDEDVLKVQIIENVQREAVPFMEEADGVRKLRDDCVLDVKEIARTLGKSDAYVYLMLKLTSMPKEVQDIARNGWITKSVAWEIAKLPNSDYQIQAANDLARTKSGDHISPNRARFYISENFGELGRKKRSGGVAKLNGGNDFVANWKHYLVRFTGDQFEAFKKIVRGRTETSIIAEAVDVVMAGGEKE